MHGRKVLGSIPTSTIRFIGRAEAQVAMLQPGPGSSADDSRQRPNKRSKTDHLRTKILVVDGRAKITDENLVPP